MEHQGIFRAIFSDVDIHFRAEAINSVTSEELDRVETISERSQVNLATQVNQILVDVQSLDAQELNEWASQHIGEPISENRINRRMKRFINAFQYMFPNKKYKGVQTTGGAKRIVFVERGRETDISQLSSGEKQVVYRGSFLLKNKGTLANAVILIDEPEISMHPTWQMKILNYYKHLFIDEEGFSTNQLIVSTHSPFIIHNSRRSEDMVIVLKKDEKGDTAVSPQPSFMSWSYEKAVEDAFQVPLFSPSIKAIVFVEGPTDEKYFRTAMKVFFNNSLDIEIEWVGRAVTKDKSEFTGDGALNDVRLFFLANPKMLHRKVILLYDNDTNKQEETYPKLYIRSMAKSKGTTVMSKGVESLLTLQSGFDLAPFYSQRPKTGDYGEAINIPTFEKQKLCDHICDNLPETEQRVILSAIAEEIMKISGI